MVCVNNMICGVEAENKTPLEFFGVQPQQESEDFGTKPQDSYTKKGKRAILFYADTGANQIIYKDSLIFFVIDI